MDSFASARLRSAAAMLSGEPVITVGKKRVTPQANMRADGMRDLFVAWRLPNYNRRRRSR